MKNFKKNHGTADTEKDMNSSLCTARLKAKLFFAQIIENKFQAKISERE